MIPRKRKQADGYESQPGAARQRTDALDEGEKTGLKGDGTVIVARCPKTTDPFTQYLYDDVFIQVLRFIVSASGLVDGDTFRSATAVSKRWHALTNRPDLWTISDDDIDVSLRSSLPSRPSPWIREKLTKSDPSRFFNLIGFVNLGLQEGDRRLCYDEPGNVSYKVRERATGKRFLLNYQSEGKNDEALRELANVHRIHGQDFLTVGSKEDSCWHTPVGAEMCQGKIMLWYPCYDQTLTQLILSHGASSSSVSIQTIKRWIRGILRLLASVHERGIALSNIQDTTLRLRNCTDDMSKSMLVLCCPTQHDVSWDGIKRTTSHQLVDVNCVGYVFTKVMESGIFAWHEAVPDGKAFQAFLRSLIYSCSCGQHSRITAAEALSNVILVTKDDDSLTIPSSMPPVSSSVAFLRHNLALEASAPPLDPDRPHMQPEHWAKLYDWIVEIAEVFGGGDRCPFRAMQFLDRFVSSSTSPITRDKYQLIAGTCMRLATLVDFHQFTPALTEDALIKSADHTFDFSNVKEAETAILSKLQPLSLGYPTIVDFVHCYVEQMDNVGDIFRSLALYVSELAMQCQIYRFYEASKIAAAVFVLSRYAFHLSVQELDNSTDDSHIWPEQLQTATGYDGDTLEPVLLQLSEELEHIESTLPELRMIVRKYRRRNGVSAIHIPRVTPAVIVRLRKT